MNALQEFIDAHFDSTDLNRLLLNAAKFPGVDVPEAVRQIAGLKKMRIKVPSWRSTNLRIPDNLSVQQCSSETTALFKASLFQGKQVIDLSGGLGVDTWAFSRYFESVTYVEPEPVRCQCASHNFTVLGLEQVQVHCDTAESFLSNFKGEPDLIYIDPSRRDQHARRVFRLEDCVPDILELKTTLLKHSPHVLLKAAPMLDIKMAINQLEFVERIWVISKENEVREVLYALSRTPMPEDQIEITAVLLNEAEKSFRLTPAEERAAEVQYVMPGLYLYDPDPALNKAGAFKSVASHFDLKKLHPNTHLYTSGHLQSAFPGRIFRLLDNVKYDKKSVQKSHAIAQANVAVRNFPDKAEQVRKRLGLSDGGDHYLFACTLKDNSKRILITQKV